jgi:transposase
MNISFVGKVALMPSKYDEQTRVRAVRLVTEHVQDYDSEWAAITAVAGGWG